ncbi:hypothetical protein HMPREF9372_1647 [Sporosarcina newyorkensis 2681]|uniref:Uncharacterized protein n=1 Tax=Sporosarcina newyorkensis 2681 TaxID=1027292 RepID=F9DS67_9BACL|nr:hypothetical protein HMPREF9372_1647 [Sporosarcina newyorkensis 2681]
MTKKNNKMGMFVSFKRVNNCIGLNIVLNISKVSMSYLYLKKINPFNYPAALVKERILARSSYIELF